jgi:hypothetical protein
MGLMKEEKLRMWKNSIRDHKLIGVTLGQMLDALIDNSLQALKIDRSRDLDQREQEIRKGLEYLRTVAAPDPDDYWQSIDGPKAAFTIDMLDEMLSAKPGTPKWFVEWKAYRERIREEFEEEKHGAAPGSV